MKKKAHRENSKKKKHRNYPYYVTFFLIILSHLQYTNNTSYNTDGSRLKQQALPTVTLVFIIFRWRRDLDFVLQLLNFKYRSVVGYQVRSEGFYCDEDDVVGIGFEFYGSIRNPVEIMVQREKLR